MNGLSREHNVHFGFLVVHRLRLYDIKGEVNGLNIGILFEFSDFLVYVLNKFFGCIEAKCLKLEFHSS